MNCKSQHCAGLLSAPGQLSSGCADRGETAMPKTLMTHMTRMRSMSDESAPLVPTCDTRCVHLGWVTLSLVQRRSILLFGKPIRLFGNQMRLLGTEVETSAVGIMVPRYVVYISMSIAGNRIRTLRQITHADLQKCTHDFRGGNVAPTCMYVYMYAGRSHMHACHTPHLRECACKQMRCSCR